MNKKTQARLHEITADAREKLTALMKQEAAISSMKDCYKLIDSYYEAYRSLLEQLENL